MVEMNFFFYLVKSVVDDDEKKTTVHFKDVVKPINESNFTI